MTKTKTRSGDAAEADNRAAEAWAAANHGAVILALASDAAGEAIRAAVDAFHAAGKDDKARTLEQTGHAAATFAGIARAAIAGRILGDGSRPRLSDAQAWELVVPLMPVLQQTAAGGGRHALALVCLAQPTAGALTGRPRSVMPRFTRLKDGALPVFGSAATLEPTPEQLPLFGASGDHALRLSCWWLDLWRASGIGARGASGYVPLPIRFRDQILGRIPATGWNGRPHLVTPPPTLRELGPMLYPDDRTWPEGIRRKWPTVRQSLMQTARQVPVTFADGSCYMWRVLDLALPVEWDPDLPVAITWNIPGGGTSGGMRINLDRLRRLGRHSTAYRAYIVARFLCDRHARRGVDKTRLLADGTPNPFIERAAQGGQILARRGAEYVRVVPWTAILPVIFDAPDRKSKRRLLEALEALRDDGLGMPGPDGKRLRDPSGIDFIERVDGVQIFGDDWRWRPDSLVQNP